MKTTFKRAAMLSVALASLSLAAPSVQAGEKIILGDLTWDEPRAINAILTEILTEKFDAEVELIAADQSAIFAAMARGDGSVDIHPAVWSAAQQANIDRYVTEGGLVRMNKKPYEASDGFYIPKAIAEKHGIKSVSDIAKKDIAKLFDVNGDGTGDYWPGAPGWGVTNIYRVKAKSYGFDEFYEPLVASDALLKAQLESATAKEQGVLFYYWTPEALHQAYDLVKLEEPKFTGFAMESKKADPNYNAKGCYNFVDPKEDQDWLNLSTIDCATPSQPIYVAYSTDLEKRAPKVASFLSNIAISADEVGAWIYDMSVKGMEPADMAKAWIKANPDRVQSWLDGAK